MLVDHRESVVEQRARLAVAGSHGARRREQHVGMTVGGLGRVSGPVAPDGFDVPAGDRVSVLVPQRGQTPVDDRATAGKPEHLAERI